MGRMNRGQREGLIIILVVYGFLPMALVLSIPLILFAVLEANRG